MIYRFVTRNTVEEKIAQVIHGDVKRNPENWISVLETKSCSASSANEIQFFSFSSWKLHKNYQMSGKINSKICFMFCVHERFQQTVKCGWQRNHKLQDLTVLEI